MPRGLTLIELLVVVAILATVAGTVLVSQSGVEDRAGQDITRHQLTELREAVLRFRRDTGYLPKQGPYALESEGGEVKVPAGQTPADFAAWFHSPANLSQLYENPLAGNTQPRDFDLDTRRGWNGPYLSKRDHQVSIGDGLASDGSSGTGGEGTRLLSVPALSDSLERGPLLGSLGVTFAWTTPAGAQDRAGRPLLLFSLDDPTQARAVSCGSDGVYAPHATSAATAPGSDDLGIYLLR
jgi:prepilin-type N-terminal cleavage/methylation domain-containing protein